ncbi:MAG: protein kinase, partial [Chloroflexota bacterium]
HDEDRGIYYMVMEHIRGGNLKALITREGKMAPVHALKVGSQLADALAYAHQRSMIHRDLKPANVMFGDDEHQQSILTDFGIARILTETGLTQSGMAVGTPAYMSPEAALGQDIDERADIYALGVMLYEMLTGNVPYSADTPLAVIMKHVNAPLPTREDFGEMIPAHVEGVILKAMAKEPDDRYDTARDMRDALDDALTEFTSKAPTRRSVKTAPTPSNTATNPTGTVQKKKPAAAAPIPAPQNAGATSTQPTIINQNTGVPWWVFVAVLFLIVAAAGGYLILQETGSDSDSNVALPPTLFVPPATVPPTAVSVAVEEENPASVEEEAVVEEAAAPPPAAIIPQEPGFYAQPYTYEPFELAIMEEMTTRYDMMRPALEVGIPHQENLDPTIGITRLLTERIYPVYADGEEPDVLYSYIDEELARSGPDDYETRLSEAMLDVEFDPAAAEATARELIEQEPDDWRGYVALSDALMTGDLYSPEEAAGAMVATENLVGRGEPQVAWRLAERVITDPEEAYALFLEAEANRAGGYRYIHFAGRILYENGDYPRALPYMVTELLEIFVSRESGTDIMDVGHRVMVSLFAMGVDDAFLEPIIEDFSVQDMTAAQYVDLAYVALQVGQFDIAQDAIEMAYELNNDAPDPFWVEGLLVAADVIGEVDPADLPGGIVFYEGEDDLNEAINLLENARNRIESGEPVESDLLTIQFERHINTDLAQVYMAVGIPSDIPYVMRSLLDPLVLEQRIQWLHPYLLKAQVQFHNGSYDIVCEDTLLSALRIAAEPDVINAIGQAREEACALDETVGSTSPGGGPPGGGGPGGDGPGSGPGGDGPGDGPGGNGPGDGPGGG